MLSEIRFFLSLRGALKAFRTTWQSLVKNEIAQYASRTTHHDYGTLFAMTSFTEYLRLFCHLLRFPMLFGRVTQNLLEFYEEGKFSLL